jgi:hypothetical protein
MTTPIPAGTILRASEFTSRGVFVSINAKVVGLVKEAKVGPDGYVTRLVPGGGSETEHCREETEHGDVKAWRDGP